jgi:hypothetical protein
LLYPPIKTHVVHQTEAVVNHEKLYHQTQKTGDNPYIGNDPSIDLRVRSQVLYHQHHLVIRLKRSIQNVCEEPYWTSNQFIYAHCPAISRGRRIAEKANLHFIASHQRLE